MNKSFETAIKELEEIVTQLENGNASLAKSIALYEKGMKLSEYCTHILETSKQKIEIINSENTSDEAPKFNENTEDTNEL